MTKRATTNKKTFRHANDFKTLHKIMVNLYRYARNNLSKEAVRDAEEMLEKLDDTAWGFSMDQKYFGLLGEQPGDSRYGGGIIVGGGVGAGGGALVAVAAEPGGIGAGGGALVAVAAEPGPPGPLAIAAAPPPPPPPPPAAPAAGNGRRRRRRRTRTITWSCSESGSDGE